MFAVLLGVVYGVLYSFEPEGVGYTGTASLRWLLAALLTATGIAVVQSVRFLVLDVAFYRTQGHRAPALVHVVIALVMYFVLALVIAGGVFHQPLTGAIATSAAASVVVGLALQETLGNFFAGIALQVEQPFRLGDVIVAKSHTGRVEAFNWRATTIQTADDTQVVIPNAQIAQEAVEVFKRSSPNRHRLVIPAPYDEPPQRIVGVIRAACNGVPGIADKPAPQVRLASFDDSSVGYEVLFWTVDSLRAAAMDAQLRQRVWYAFARNNVSIPFPHEVQVPYSPAVVAHVDDPVAERARWLSEVALLAPLTLDERQWLAERTQVSLFGPGETILRAGDEGGSMFLVLRGRVEIRIQDAQGRRVTVAEIATGEVLGEMSLLTGEPRSADVRAVGEVELVEVRRSEIKELLDANEALATALAQEVSHRIEQRADALAPAETAPVGVQSTASLLRRIRGFFELD